jgi:O-antigen/teichoic acid export membrane protein
VNSKTFSYDVLGFGVASLLSKGAYFLVVPILTFNLLPEDFGRLELFVSFSAIISLFVSLSLESYIARQWGETNDTTVRAKLLSSTMFLSAIVAAMFFIASLLLQDFLSQALFSTDSYAVVISSINLHGVFGALLSLPLIALRMQRNIKGYLILISVQSGLYICAVFYLNYLETITIESIVSAMLLSVALTLIMALYSARRYLILSFDRSLILKSLRYSLPLLPAVAITCFNGQVDKYALLYFIDIKTVGEFALVTKLTAILTLAVMVFRQAWLPYCFSLAKLPNFGRSKFRKVMNVYFGIGLALSLVLVLFAKPIFTLLAIPEYELELSVLPILLLAALVYGSASVGNVGPVISGKTEWNSYAALIGVVVNISLTCLLVPLLGVNGAAWGTLLANAIFVSVLLWRTARELKIYFQIELIVAMVCVYFLCSSVIL